MRRLFTACLIAMPLLSACHNNKTQGDAVRQAYDNQAAQVDRQAEAQPTPVAKQIYEDRANSLREEGKDREKGLEGRQPSSGPDAGSAGQPSTSQ